MKAKDILARVRPRLPGWRGASWLLLAGVFVATSGLFFTQDLDHSNTAAIRAHGDGVYYYAHLRSLVFDGDLDFRNDYQLLGDPFEEGKTPHGKLANPHPVGSALFWLPFLGLSQGVLALSGRADPLNGTSFLQQQLTFFGSLVWGFGALLLIFWLARRHGGSQAALLATAGVALATPLFWYMLRQPCFSHANSAFAVAAFAAYWAATLYQRSTRQWALLGLLAGLAMLVRPQNAGHLILPAGEWLVMLASMLRARRPRAAAVHAGHGLLLLACAALAFMPQILVWRALYGHWFTIPQGESFMYWDRSNWSAALFSSRNGLFAWTPIIMLGVAGLVLLAVRRRDRQAMTMGLLMLAAIAAQAYINGSVQDWWGGWAFGGRRFLSCSVYFGLGLAVLLHALGPAFARLGALAPRLLPAALVGGFVLFNLSLMGDHLDKVTQHWGPEPMGQRWRGALTKTFDSLYGRVGNLGSAPASWLFAARSGASPERFDAISGSQILDEKGEPFQYAFSSGRLTLAGFGEPATYREVKCIWAEGPRASLALPLREPMAIKGKILLHPARPGTRVRMRLGGAEAPFFDQKLADDWQIYDLKIPRASLATGLNIITVEQDLPPSPGYPIGATGRRTRLELTAVSAAEKVGNLATLFFNREQRRAHRRGITLFTFDPERGSHRKIRTFDTHRSANETALFAAAVARLPAGTGALVAVIGEASRSWNAAGDEALASLGAKESLRGALGASYALIGIKGARPGQAVEMKAADKPASVQVGRPIEERHRGVAWAELRLDRVE